MNRLEIKNSLQKAVFFFTGILFIAFSYLSEYALAAAAGCEDGKEYFRNAKKAFDDGRYTEAAGLFIIAQREFGLLRDYALFYGSEAFHEIGEHAEAANLLRLMIRDHPRSPLLQDARRSEIRETAEVSEANLLPLFKEYLKNYPRDEEMNFKYALFLKKTGSVNSALQIFRNIYVAGGLFSREAYSYLDDSDIKSPDLVERASNLIKNYEFSTAERDLRKAVSLDDGRNKNEILKKLGYALFRQRKYSEAAIVYDRIGETYYKARSFYRAGNTSEFEKSLLELIRNNNRNAGQLLVADAADKRRSREYETSLQIYNDALKNYPEVREEAMWGIAWTYYTSGAYDKAVEMLAKMYSLYDEPKYLYWQARSLESSDNAASHLYKELIERDNNFYGFLARERKGEPALTPVSFSEIPITVPSDNPEIYDRIEAFLEFSMTKAAVKELVHLSRKISSPEEFIYVISKLQDLGEFKRAISLASTIPYSEKLHRFWYPYAFWDTVNEISKKYGLDPFVALSVMREESRFDTDAKSIAGARGLMQIMPQTAFILDRRLNLGINKDSQLHDVENNVRLGMFYLKSLFNEFKSLAYVLAAYNAGEQLVRKWEQRGNYRETDEFIEDIPYPETRNYVKKVMTSYFQYKKFSAVKNPQDRSYEIIQDK